MSLITIIFIAFGLAMDAFAVSISNGLNLKKFNINFAIKLGVFFGGFQALMPILGYLASLSIRDYIAKFDYWIAFILLTLIGSKMIYEAFVIDENKDKKELSFYMLIILSIATSIDALAVGVSLTFLKVNIMAPAVIIGIITFFMSFLGVLIGSKFGKFFENKIEILGGIILIGIGLKILLEHI